MSCTRYLGLCLSVLALSACQRPVDTPTKQQSEKKYVRGYIQAQVPERKQDQATGGTGTKSIYIPNVNVVLSEAASGTPVGEVVTDLSGRFSFPAQKSGQYKLCWKLDGYKSDCLPSNVQVNTRPVNIGSINIKPLADSEKNVVIYGKVGLRDEQAGRTLEPIVDVNAFVAITATDTKGAIFYKTTVNNFGEYLLPNVPRDEVVVSVTAKTESEEMTRQTYKEVLHQGPAHRVDITLRDHVPRILEVVAKVGGKEIEYAQPGDVVDLSVKAVDVDGDTLNYIWQLERGEGTLSSTTGANVSWTLPAAKGLYSAILHVGDGHGGYAESRARVSVGVDKARFSGQVVTATGAPIAGANVSIGGTADTAVSNATGYFNVTTALASRYTLNIHKAGFNTASKIYNRSNSAGRYTLYQTHGQSFDPTKDIVAIDPNKQRECYVPAIERVDWKTFAATHYVRKQDGTGKTVAIGKEPYQSQYPGKFIAQRKEHQCGPGVEVKIPANSLTDDAGNAPVGPVTVELNTVDLSAPDSMPGDYSVNDGSYLESYGAGSVTITAGGVSYHKLKAGTKALLRIPVADIQLAAGGSIPATIPKLVYNEKTGLWEADGVLKLDASGKYYEAEVTHFSTINADVKKSGQSCIRFKSQGMPIPFNLDVLVPLPGAAPQQRTGVITANDEYDLIINLPNNTDITLTAYTVSGNQVVPEGIFTVNTGGAQTGTPSAPNYSECQNKIIIFPVEEPTPGADAFLHGLYSFFATKVAEGNGSVPNPALKAQLQQATIDYYNTLDPRGRRNTFTKFKAANNFVADGHTTLKANYAATDEVRAAFANAGDLGFGRDMHGKRTLADDGQYDIAFYVTNYGDYASNDEGDHEEAVGQDPTKVVATVAMEWSRLDDGPATAYDYYDPANVTPDPNDPNAPITHASSDRVIKFYVFNKLGQPVFAADLDGRGARPVPQLCMVCHGGAYAGGFNTGTPAFSQPIDVKLGSLMLPFDIHGYVFSGAVPADFTKTGEQVEFHQLNTMVVDTQPGAVINEIISNMYSASNPAGADTQIEDFVVTGWNLNGAHRDMYLNVIKPACRECHSARPLEDNGGGVTRDLRMQDVQQFLKTDANGGIAIDASNRVCTQRVMPHALATYNRFWHSYNPIDPLQGMMYQPSRLQAFFDGVVKPVLGVQLGAGCVTTPTPDDSVIEEPTTLTLLQTEIFGGCSGCHSGAGNSSTFPYVNLNLSNGHTFSSTVNVNSQESTGGLKRIKPNEPNNSYLFKKVSGPIPGAQCSAVAGASGCTDAMPPPGGGLTQANLDDIAEWINNNAPNN